MLLDSTQGGIRDQRERLVPADANERLLPPQMRFGVSPRVGEIGTTNHRSLNPGGVIGAAQNAIEQHLGGHGIEIFQRLDTDQHAVLHDSLERPVMRGMGNQDGVRSEHFVDPENFQCPRRNGDGSSGLEELATIDLHDGSP